MLEGKLICMETLGGELYFIGNYTDQKSGSIFLHVLGIIQNECGEVVILESDDRSINMYFKNINEDKQEQIKLTPLSDEEETEIYKIIIEMYGYDTERLKKVN